MSRIGAIVRRLYEEDLRSTTDDSGKTVNAKPNRPNKKKDKLTAFKKALSSRRTAIWAIRIGVVLVVLFIAAESIFQFNRLASWQTVVMARRADVNRELQRRQNLIPNLVFAASKYASYEQEVFKHVSDAREFLSVMRSSPASNSPANSMLEKALSRLIALAEQYPDLKATQSIQDLIAEAANTEDRIADVKQEYNKACEVFNQYMSIFPGNFFGWIYRYKVATYIGLEEDAEVPVMNLDMTGQAEGFKGAVEASAIGQGLAGQYADTETNLKVSAKNKNLEETEGVKE